MNKTPEERILEQCEAVCYILGEMTCLIVKTGCTIALYGVLLGIPICFYLFRIGFFDYILYKFKSGKNWLRCSWSSSIVSIFFQDKGYVDFMVPNEVTLDQEFQIEKARIWGLGFDNGKFKAVGILKKNSDDLNHYLEIRADIRQLKLIVRGNFNDRTKRFNGYYVLGKDKTGQIKGRLNWLFEIKEVKKTMDVCKEQQKSEEKVERVYD